MMPRSKGEFTLFLHISEYDILTRQTWTNSANARIVNVWELLELQSNGTILKKGIKKAPGIKYIPGRDKLFSRGTTRIEKC